MQVIKQVEGGFSVRGYGMTLIKNKINWHVALGMVGMFSLARRYEGTMPRHAFDLLLLVVESYIQINQVNSIVIERSRLIMAVNTCCGVTPAECRTNHSIYDRVMRLTNWAAKKQGAGGAAPVEGCAFVYDGERHEQTHPLPAICRGRLRGGKHPGPVDGNQQIRAHHAEGCARRDVNTGYGRLEEQKKRDVE